MQNLLDPICKALGWFLYFIYNNVAFHNYGLAIILFTVIVKLVLLPLTVKQYKSTARMQEVQPQIQEIQKRYKNDKEKLNQELMKVYSEHKVNPAGGCAPLLVQMPIIISLYWVIVQPLKFMLNKSTDVIDKIVAVAAKADETLLNVNMLSQKELKALNYFNEHRDKLPDVSAWLKQSELINFKFLGLELGWTPDWHIEKLFGPQSYIYLPLMILPILAVVTTFFSTKISMASTKINNPDSAANATMNSMSNSMMYIGPIMTLFFSFQMPAGVILYWSVGYVFQIFQQLYLNKVIARHKAEAEERKQLAATQLREKEAAEKALLEENIQSSKDGKSGTKGGQGNAKKGGAKKK